MAPKKESTLNNPLNIRIAFRRGPNRSNFIAQAIGIIPPIATPNVPPSREK